MLIYFTPGTGKTTYLKSHAGIDGDNLLIRELQKLLLKQREDLEKLYNSDGSALYESIYNLYKDGYVDDIERAYQNYEYVLSNNFLGENKPLCLFGSVRLMRLADKVYLEQDEDILRQRGKIKPRFIINRELSEAKHEKIIYELLNSKFVSDVL